MGTFPTSSYVICSISAGNYVQQIGGIVRDNDISHTELAASEDETLSLDEDHTAIGPPSGTTTWKGSIEFGGETFHMFEFNDSGTFFLTSEQPATAFSGTGDFPNNIPVSGGLNTSDFVYCFAAGTAIATPNGEIAVEDLSIGDAVLTPNGRAVPVKWLGRQTLMKRFGVAERMEPMRIAAGALGAGLPHSDLTVTADHGMILDGLVINAAALVNGTTITFVPRAQLPDVVTYYYIETADHDVILTNGTEAETFVTIMGDGPSTITANTSPFTVTTA